MGYLMIKEKNAIITRVSIDNERGGLTAYLHLDYGGSGQGFGGYCLYTENQWDEDSTRNYCGRFISRCLSIGDVEEWSQLAGKTIRVRAEHGKVHAIGHIVKDDWFNPSEDFK